MYDPDHLKGMTEETPFKPVSKKGQIRKEVAEMILEEVKQGDLKALIARAPDFLSPHNSVLTEMALKNLKKGKKANWPGLLDKIHSFIYTPDAAKATALLGNTDEAFNQTWHLPTDSTPYTGMDWVTMAAEITGSKPKAATMSAGMMKFLGIFIPVLKEITEMNYQYERDYLFDSSKFMEKFDFKYTPANEALEKVMREL